MSATAGYDAGRRLYKWDSGDATAKRVLWMKFQPKLDTICRFSRVEKTA